MRKNSQVVKVDKSKIVKEKEDRLIIGYDNNRLSNSDSKCEKYMLTKSISWPWRTEINILLLLLYCFPDTTVEIVNNVW